MPNFEKSKTTNLWSIRFRVEQNGKIIRKRLGYYKTKNDALNAYIQYLSADNKSDCIPYKLEEVFEMYIKLKKSELKESTIIAMHERYNNFIKPFFAKEYIQNITKQDVMKFQQYLTLKNYSYKYKVAIRSLLNSIFEYAKDFLGLKENVVANCKGFKNSVHKEMNIWSIEEYKKFISQVDDEIYNMLFELIFTTGVRKGEALALQVKDVLPTKEINITKTYSEKTNKGFYTIHNTPKTFSSIRKVMLPNKTYINLLKYIKDNNIKPNQFLFFKDRPIPETTLRRYFDFYIEKANVTKITIHELRHSHASMLINANEPISVVSKRLGHANIEETLNTYTHVLPSEQKELANRLDKLI